MSIVQLYLPSYADIASTAKRLSIVTVGEFMSPYDFGSCWLPFATSLVFSLTNSPIALYLTLRKIEVRRILVLCSFVSRCLNAGSKGRWSRRLESSAVMLLLVDSAPNSSVDFTTVNLATSGSPVGAIAFLEFATADIRVTTSWHSVLFISLSMNSIASVVSARSACSVAPAGIFAALLSISASSFSWARALAVVDLVLILRYAGGIDGDAAS